MSGPYLVGLLLEGRRVVVLGGGTVATRRVPRLLEAGADVLLISPEVSPALRSLAAAGELRWEPRPYRPGDLEAAWYALALTDDADANAAACAEAEASRTPCVRADQAEGGTAVTTAGGLVGGVHFGVVTWGLHAERDPRRAAAIRDRLVRLLEAQDAEARDAPSAPRTVHGGPPGDDAPPASPSSG